ncbi:UPF0587 protein [Porphyridium purpureum]|uniref:UPF0587 protein n=1 Tax=Porphyridium purpureum TaxID=35688 RepID=A0A5J4Z3S2_PORPP|nr:UPF0587 protein [Porphyridium purpureum]|eukprot:POR7302..scf295_1
MPIFTLEVRAHLDGVASVTAGADYDWMLWFTCTNCGEKTDNALVFHESDKVEQVRGAVVNLQVKCKFCERVNDASIVTHKASPHTYTSAYAPDWHPFCEFEARGMQPAAWEMMPGLAIVGESGVKFDESVLESTGSTYEFFGYDEKAKASVSITEWEYRITSARSRK